MLIFLRGNNVEYQTFPIPDSLPPDARLATPAEKALIESKAPVKWDGKGNVVRKSQVEVDEEKAQAKRGRMRVTAFQALAELERLGLLEQAEQIVANSDRRTQIAWEKAPYFSRTTLPMTSLAPQLGMNEVAQDRFFENAAKIEA